MAYPSGIYWHIPPNDGTANKYDWEKIRAALLMDIRAALAPLRHLDCRNFQMIPKYLRILSGGDRPNRAERLRRRERDHRRAVKRARRPR